LICNWIDSGEEAPWWLIQWPDGHRATDTLYPEKHNEAVEQAMQATPIEGQGLTSWDVPPGGTQISLDFIGIDGGAHRIVLPFDALSGLMMTLPRMVQSALDERFPDGSFRVLQRLGQWQLEQPATDAGLILKLGTKDGFEVAFLLDDEHGGSLGAALPEAPRERSQLW
jgi:hypothetical protein